MFLTLGNTVNLYAHNDIFSLRDKPISAENIKNENQQLI